MNPANPEEPEEPIIPEEPDARVLQSVFDSYVPKATANDVHNPGPQTTLSLDASRLGKDFNNLCRGFLYGDMDPVVAKELVHLMAKLELAHPMLTKSTPCTFPSRLIKQTDQFSLMRGLFPSIISLPQTEALRARASNRSKLRRRRNRDGSILYAAYAPYATVSDSKTQNMLLRIYDKLHFLDRGFAEYFTSIVEGDAAHVRTQFQDIRRRFASAQNPNVPTSGPDNDVDVNLGDLGHFCEQVLQVYEAAKPYKFPGGPIFHVTCGDVTDKLNYLQDALEVPYWDLMLKHFGIWRANSHGLMGKAILSIIYSAKLELKVAVAELMQQAAARGIMEDLAPIVKGIKRRIELLDSVRDSSVDGLHILEEILRRSDFLPDYYVTLMPSTAIIPTTTTQTPVVSMVAAICLLVLALPPFAVGFHLAGTKGGVGSFQDAGFWFLVQGNIMSTLGSVLMVVPMLREPWFSLIYLSVWLMLGGGLVCSIVSVAIFTHVHTGWSSAFVLFGSMMSAWAVLIMAQGEGSKVQEAEKVEVKDKLE
ncbi:hypothetical protein B0T11DRAFT_354651 [Plectosphaerella cucumerina]|uniref:Uncharacterized protein n=1 Tax=Plectosphaerella cucumerina TaxID=40658 RepID=A0A8K0TG73_9PEZI|nr:hypothetical protein B0T11DRAFT_354651 [Plectosphaerella cucumerina]